MTSAVFRDEWGIPHLRAESVDDLSYLQGRVAALDRAWQIEVERWRSEGRLAERLGAAEVGWDRFARRARLDDTARRCFTRLRPETQRWLTSYVAGVNSALDTASAPEFAATGTRPGRWRPWSPLGVFLVQHILFGTFPHKMWRAAYHLDLPPQPTGSNAWACAGRLAGDPHRVLELPGIYQQIRLACPEFDVVGLAFPGVPGVPHFGHAGPVAWAVTNAMADYQDLYVEQSRPVAGGVEVRSADGWAPASVHVEKILVRDAEPVSVEIVETPRGPVIDDGISLRTPARVEFDLGFDCFLPLLRAKTAGDVADALAGWVEPVNSVIAADSTGTILSFVAGRVPRRSPRNRRVPVPAWQPEHDWQGYEPLPRTRRPSVVNANNRRSGDTAALGVDFAPPHRARRITRLLGADPSTIHMDDRLPPPSQTVLHGLEPVTPAGRALRDRLLAWDGRMAATSADAGWYAAWRSTFVRRLVEHLDPTPARTFDPLFAPWLDPVGRIGLAADRYARQHPRLAAAALDEVAAGPDPGTWGSRHQLFPVHVVPATALGRSVELAGDTDCVLATSSVPGVSDLCWRGPVARYVWDLTDRAASRWIVPFGAAGDPADPHFADQLPLWARGDLIPVVTDWTRLTLAATQ